MAVVHHLVTRCVTSLKISSHVASTSPVVRNALPQAVLHEAIYLMPFSFDVLNWKRIRTAWWCTRFVAAAVEQILVRFSRLHSLNSIFFCHVIHKGHRVTRPLPASLLEAQCHMTRGRWARRIRCDLVARGTLA